jgi:hypothetical protein
VAKGKGELLTYWLETDSNTTSGQSSHSSDSGMASSNPTDQCNIPCSEVVTANRRKSLKLLAEKTERLVDWNSDVLCRLLQQIMVSRGGTTSKMTIASNDFDWKGCLIENGTNNPFDEVKEIIALPPLNKFRNLQSVADIQLPKMVMEQLRNYIAQIAAMYNNNQFHNFEHVST